jgi:S1-C subfamily serine protease
MTAGLLCGALYLTAFPPPAIHASAQDEDHLARLYKHLAPATVFLSVIYESPHPLSTPTSTGVGAGFLIDKTGTLLTNAHVVDGASSITATLFDGERVTAELLALDASEDIAILQLPPAHRTYPMVTLGDSDSLRVGQSTLVVGSPFGLGFTLTSGILSGLGPLVGPQGSAAARVIQTTAPINPGNSGGPLVDSKGHVIGITTAALMGAQNIGFAIPINIARQALAELKAKGTIARPWLGIGGKFPTEHMIGLFTLPLAGGLLIEDVEDGSPAAEAGLKAGTLNVTIEGIAWVLGGDILLALDGQPTRDAEAFMRAVKRLSPGQRVQLEILRNGERLVLSVLLQERPRGSLRSALTSSRAAVGTPSRGLPWMQALQITGF